MFRPYALINIRNCPTAIIIAPQNTERRIPQYLSNLRIIDAVAHRLEVPREKVLINIERYGNTSAATLPLCIWDFATNKDNIRKKPR